MSPAFAIDLGGSRVRVSRVALAETLQPTYAETDASHGAAGLVDQIVDLVHKTCGETPDRGGVIATPGAVDSSTGIISKAANLPLSGFPLGEVLSQRLGVDVRVVVDTAAAVVAEFGRDGAAAKCTIGAYVTVSTGIGSSLVVDRRVVRGAHARAGELGHTPVNTGSHAAICPCGQRGCLEAYASGAGLARLGGIAGGPTGARQVIDAAREGQDGPGQLVDQAVELLARSLSGLVHILDPEAVVLGGGLLLGGGLFEVVVDRVAEMVVIPGWTATNVLRQAAYGELSPLVGAVALAAGDPIALHFVDWDN